MFSRKQVRAVTLSLAALVAAPSVGSARPALQSPAEAGRHNPRRTIKKKIARKLDEQAVKSLERTRTVLRAALQSVKQQDGGRAELVAAVLHQRASAIALHRGKPGAALWLTRAARQKARQLIQDNRAEQPAGGADQPAEWSRADGRDAPRFIEIARRMRASKRVAKAMARTRALVADAARAVKEGGEGKAQLRKAVVYQKAARKAGSRGKDKAALHLTRQARQAARAVIEANGGAAAPIADEAAELAGADPTGSEEFTAIAEASVPQDIDPVAVEDAVTDDEMAAEIADDLAVDLEATDEAESAR